MITPMDIKKNRCFGVFSGLIFAAGLVISIGAQSVSAVAQSNVKILEKDKSGRDVIRKGLKKNKSKNNLTRAQKKRLKSGKKNSGKKLFNPDPTHPANQFEPGELVVLDPPKGFASAIGSMGFKVTESVRLDGLGMQIYRLKVPRGMSVPDARASILAQFPGVTVDANHQFDPSAKPINARAAMGWRNVSRQCGRGIRLGMLDSGVNIKHPALKGQKITARNFFKKGRRPGPSVHGTAIASMLVGKPEWGGLLPGAQLMAANMFETRKDGRKVGSAIGLLKGLNWLTKANVDAINLSVAGADNKVLRVGFDRARKNGQVLIAAAGNWGRSDRPAFPAAYKYVLAVTAVSQNKRIYSKANRGKYIDFAAPGVKIYAAVPGGGKAMSGTSFAVPYITAIVAQRISQGSSKRINDIRKWIANSTQDLGRSGKDNTFGYGFVKLRPKCG